MLVFTFLVKSDSRRLPKKNFLELCGKPMWKINLDKVYELGHPILLNTDTKSLLARDWTPPLYIYERSHELRGHHIPSVPIIFDTIKRWEEDYKKAVSEVVNIQVNSPQVSLACIKEVIECISSDGVSEVLTQYSSGEINGSVWAFKRHRLADYGDYYTHYPDRYVMDDSIDIHTKEDFDLASKQLKS